MRCLRGRDWVVLAAIFIVLLQATGTAPRSNENPRSVIVQGEDLEAAADAVRAVGGNLTHELRVINAVAARMDKNDVARIESIDGVKVFVDEVLEVNAPKQKPGGQITGQETHAATLVGADALHPRESPAGSRHRLHRHLCALILRLPRSLLRRQR